MGEASETYSKAIKSLEDLRMLSSSDVTPIIHQLYYYFNKLEREIGVKQKDPYERLTSFTRDALKNQIINHLNNKFEIYKIEYEDNFENCDISVVDKHIRVISSILEVIDCFKFAGQINVLLSNNNISIKGMIEYDSQIKEHRERIYLLTKKLFKERSVMTFKLDEEGNKNNLEVSVDMADANSFYLVKSEHGNFAIDGVFTTFLVSKIDTDCKEGVCIKISDHLDIEYVDSAIINLNESSEIMHFNFLFRPLSVIIPIGGELFHPKDRPVKSTGSGENVTGWDIYSKSAIYYIDFFELFSS